MIITRLQNGLKVVIRLLLQRWRILRKQTVIHVFGDSHSLLFQHPAFFIHYVGPSTAFNLRSDTSSTQSKKKIFDTLAGLDHTSRQFLMFVFGEIDARIHVYNIHKQKNRAIVDVIDATIESYEMFLREVVSVYPKCTFLVCAVVPAGEQGNYYNYPYYASRDERVEITRLMNESLERMCLRHSWTFVNVNHLLVESDGSRKKEYVFDDIHFSDRIVPFIVDDLKTKGFDL
jgi:hypothetical protein